MKTQQFQKLTSSKLDGSTCSYIRFLRRLWIWPLKYLILPVAPAIPKIVFGGRRSMLGDLLQLTSFKVVLNPNLEGILNLEREIWNSHCVSQYGKISDSGMRRRLDDFLQFISLKVVLDPNFKRIVNLKREIWNSNCVSKYSKINDGC